MSQTSSSSISEKMTRLDELIAWFNSDNFELEAALEKFSQAKQLADDIEHDLMEFKNTITVVSEQFDREEA